MTVLAQSNLSAGTFTPTPRFAGSADVLNQPMLIGKVGAGAALKAGTVLGRLTTGGKLVPSISGASDGSQLAVAILVGSLWAFGSINHMIDVTFRLSDRHDASITFTSVRPMSALFEARRLPAVLEAEPFRALSVKLRHGPAEPVTGSVAGHGAACAAWRPACRLPSH